MRLIDADALKEYLSNRYMQEIFPDWWELSLDVREKIGLLGSTFKQAIVNSPTIYAEPVRRGEWKLINTVRGDKLRCMECGHYTDLGVCNHNYCPDCGSKNELK